MKYLLLWLEGPLQSWGADSRFDLRQTRPFPTQSGIFGMLLAASGDSGPQEQLLAEMADAPFSVISFVQEKRTLVDFHMVGNGYDEKDPWQTLNIPRKPDGGKAVNGGAKRTYREYLQDCCFAVILGLPDHLTEKFADALQNPVYDLYLGRKCCVPSTMIFQGVFANENEALTHLKEKLIPAGTAEKRPLTPHQLIKTVPCGEDPDAVLINDVPVRFGNNRLYRDRWVSIQDFAE